LPEGGPRRRPAPPAGRSLKPSRSTVTTTWLGSVGLRQPPEGHGGSLPRRGEAGQPSDRIKAAELMFNRVLGKPKESVAFDLRQDGQEPGWKRVVVDAIVGTSPFDAAALGRWPNWPARVGVVPGCGPGPGVRERPLGPLLGSTYEGRGRPPGGSCVAVWSSQ
jgi:hypothetical protein